MEQYLRQILQYTGFARLSLSAGRQVLLIQPVIWQGKCSSNLVPPLGSSVGVEGCRVQHWTLPIFHGSWSWTENQTMLRWLWNTEKLPFTSVTCFKCSFWGDLKTKSCLDLVVFSCFFCFLKTCILPSALLTLHKNCQSCKVGLMHFAGIIYICSCNLAFHL